MPARRHESPRGGLAVAVMAGVLSLAGTGCGTLTNLESPRTLAPGRWTVELEGRAISTRSEVVRDDQTPDAVSVHVGIREGFAVDARVVGEVLSGGGRIIDHVEEVGGFPSIAPGTAAPDADHDGMPDAWESGRGLDPGDPADGAADPDGDGYTNLEDY